MWFQKKKITVIHSQVSKTLAKLGKLNLQMIPRVRIFSVTDWYVIKHVIVFSLVECMPLGVVHSYESWIKERGLLAEHMKVTDL